MREASPVSLIACAKDHVKIMFPDNNREVKCPLCRKIAMVEVLNREIDEMEKICDRMAEKNEQMKERCICGKLAE